jgi:integrase
MLEVTGGGRARDFRRARDHAIIRMFTEGVRRAELVQIRMADLPLDLIATPYVRVVPLKGARAEEEGRIVPLTPATAQAILAYVRARRGHPKVDTSPALWLGDARPTDRLRRLPHDQLPRRGGGLRPDGVPAYVPPHLRDRLYAFAMTGSILNFLRWSLSPLP